jgi:hypothetical protein
LGSLGRWLGIGGSGGSGGRGGGTGTIISNFCFMDAYIDFVADRIKQLELMITAPRSAGYAHVPNESDSVEDGEGEPTAPSAPMGEFEWLPGAVRQRGVIDLAILSPLFVTL